MHSTQPNNYENQRRLRGRRDYLTSGVPLRNGDMRSEDSWIDLASQPTGSIYPDRTTDATVVESRMTSNNDRSGSNNTIRSVSHLGLKPASADGSSQDEYEESESESDQVLSSSNEDVTKMTEDEDEDDRTTALGSRSDEAHIFTPQPNAFSHPPASNNIHSAPAPNSYFPTYSQATYSDRLPSNRIITNRSIAQRQHSRDHFASSRSQPDHDAALRASLTTLLSCAAAVRPKGRETATTTAVSNQPRILRLVPESQLGLPSNHSTQPTTKRKSRESSKDRLPKKVRAHRPTIASEDLVSPTLMTWMISAGVVLVFSAISFSAGYVWGKEAVGFDSEIHCTSCGREALRTGGSGGTLRRLRWSPTTQSIRA